MNSQCLTSFVKKALDEAKVNGLSDEQTAKVTAQFMDGNWKKLDASDYPKWSS